MEHFRSGTYLNQGYYKSFQPELLMRTWSFGDMQLLNLLSKADRHLGRLDMYSEYVNIDLFIKLHIAKEATQSSKIEGTQTNIEDVFLHKERNLRSLVGIKNKERTFFRYRMNQTLFFE